MEDSSALEFRSGPVREYQERLKARETCAARYERLHIRYGYLRLAIVAAALALAWFSIGRSALSPWWLALPLAAFAVVAFYHARALRERAFAERAATFYRNGLARVEDRWTGIGPTGERFNDPHHIYSGDLDLFGQGSLFQLVSTARTRMGEERLAKWFLTPSSPSDIAARQAAVAELRSKLDLREQLSVLGEEAAVGIHADELFKWAEADPVFKSAWPRWMALILAAGFVASAAVWGYWGIAAPLIAVIGIEAALALRLKKSIGRVLHGTEHAFADLDLLREVLRTIESQSFEAPRLRALSAQLTDHYLAGSTAMARLGRIVDLIDSRDNLILRVLDLPLLYSVQVAYAAESWRTRHGSAVRRWLDVVAEFEALVSLSSYSYEHPEDPFPKFTESRPACFEAEELGHPLIPSAACVRNDVRLSGDTCVLLVSGSNMSGKSTLLRAVGMNTVLAMAGAPVRARRLRVTPLQVGASIRVNDSLQEGSSRFYAEITRIRSILQLASGRLPVLFLLDEVLQGTNSHDRRIGAEGILRTLVERGAIGLVSTHDLALTNVESVLRERLRNVHLEDHIENGKMRFDYRLRDGVVQKSNGLELMRSVGIEV